ncbi:tRNA-pseudouridine synthase [Coprinopsis sp. MPI-PUGE-AT-0042]|nr:tRNA-pseudouridine synthase [Coprinopsis sp. MPI-PUGE-AT-0042]
MILRPTATSFFHALNPTSNGLHYLALPLTFSTPSTLLLFLCHHQFLIAHPHQQLTAINRSTKRHLNLIPLSPAEQFKHNLFSLIRSTLMSGEFDFTKPKEVPAPPGLKKIAPYWPRMLEVVSTEFRDRSMEYYRYALESGIASPTTILRDGDRVEHEPPVTLYAHAEREFIVVDKPGSIPVHASGRYYKNTLIEILVNDFGIPKCYPANRLDRLTSGLMIIPTSPARPESSQTSSQKATVKKEYIARVRGKFPEEPVTCSEPLLTVDRQMGLNIVHPEGKPALTVFTRLFYDEGTDSSVVRCEPHTGRSHQLRVHLQFLGHPIANDPVYSEQRIWGASMGKAGVDTTPSDERSAPAPPPSPPSPTSTGDSTNGGGYRDGSPVPLSAEAVGVITRLRNMKDEDEDWSRWRDVVFRVKGALNPHHLVVTPPPLPNRRKRGGKAKLMIRPSRGPPGAQTESLAAAEGANSSGTSDARTNVTYNPPQFTEQEIIQKVAEAAPSPDLNALAKAARSQQTIQENLYCPECYLPLHPDPRPEKLYIFLHARKYTTSLGAFETEMPEWATPGWSWDQS